MAGQVRQAGGLRLADPVLDAGVLAVPQLEPTELTGHDTVTGVGEERRHPHAVAVGEAELRTGTRPLLAQDQPTPDRPDDNSTSSVASATQAPSRIPPP